jgi:hypothetical protein
MIKNLFVVFACWAGGFAVAAPAISLAPMPGESKIDVVRTENFTGSCGSAIVRVMGVQNPYGDTLYRMEIDSARIIVRGTNRELVLDMQNGLDSLVGLSCVQTKAGSRLLVWTNCGGTSCPFLLFTIIDPDKARIVVPRNPGKDTCDEKCAVASLGRKLPVALSL